MRPKDLTRAHRALNAIARIEALHVKRRGSCGHCETLGGGRVVRWPCPTIEALHGDGQTVAADLGEDVLPPGGGWALLKPRSKLHYFERGNELKMKSLCGNYWIHADFELWRARHPTLECESCQQELERRPPHLR